MKYLKKFCPSFIVQNFVKYFVHFLGNGVSRENAFEIYWPLKCPKIAGSNSLFFKIAGAKAPIAPVLNWPLLLFNISGNSPIWCQIFLCYFWPTSQSNLFFAWPKDPISYFTSDLLTEIPSSPSCKQYAPSFTLYATRT